MTGLGKSAFGVAAALGLMSGLGGCSGGTTGVVNPSVAYDTTQTAFLGEARSIVGYAATGQTGLSHTSLANMPTSGTAEFDGYAKVFAVKPGDSSASFVAYGTAKMNADFGAGTLTGSASNFYGGPADPTTKTLTSKAAAYAGTIALSRGCIGPTACSGAVANSYDVKALATGTLTGGGHKVTVNAPLTGMVYGNPKASALAIQPTASDAIAAITVDGTTMDGGAAFVGTKK